MKTHVFICSFFLFIGLSSCNEQKKDKEMELTGKVEAIEMSTYQYGTHTLKTSDKTYALTSGSVNLPDIEGKTVTIIGERVEGYPVEEGPEYIKVNEVKE